MRTLLSTALYWSMQAGLKAKGIRILCYHRVNDEEKNYLTVPVKNFEEQMQFLSQEGYRTLRLADLIRPVSKRLSGEEEFRKGIVITFDDGFRDNYLCAYPVLKRYGFSAAIFCIAQQIGRAGYLEKDQILDMAENGFEFGSHTFSHPDLRKIGGPEKISEIADSRDWLKETLGLQCNFFCYPYGRYDDEAVSLVREAGYFGACSNLPGVNEITGKANPYLLRRTEISGEDSLEDFKKKLAGAFDLLHAGLHWMRGRP